MAAGCDIGNHDLKLVAHANRAGNFVGGCVVDLKDFLPGKLAYGLVEDDELELGLEVVLLTLLNLACSECGYFPFRRLIVAFNPFVLKAEVVLDLMLGHLFLAST